MYRGEIWWANLPEPVGSEPGYRRPVLVIQDDVFNQSRCKLYEVIWKDQFVEKLAVKHSVTTDEVEQVLFSRLYVRKAQKGRVKGEDLYAAYGQTDAGRYLIIFFVRKNQTSALPISARDMTESERRYYERQT